LRSVWPNRARLALRTRAPGGPVGRPRPEGQAHPPSLGAGRSNKALRPLGTLGPREPLRTLWPHLAGRSGGPATPLGLAAGLTSRPLRTLRARRPLGPGEHYFEFHRVAGRGVLLGSKVAETPSGGRGQTEVGSGTASQSVTTDVTPRGRTCSWRSRSPPRWPGGFPRLWGLVQVVPPSRQSSTSRYTSTMPRGPRR